MTAPTEPASVSGGSPSNRWRPSPPYRAELHPIGGEHRKWMEAGDPPVRRDRLGAVRRLLGVKSASSPSGVRRWPGSLSHPNPTADLAGAYERGNSGAHEWTSP